MQPPLPQPMTMVGGGAQKLEHILGGTPMHNRKTACFEALVLEPHFAQILRPLLATLLPPWLAEFSASIILLEDAKCEIAGLPNTCGLHMFNSEILLSRPFKQVCFPFHMKARVCQTTLEQSFAMAAMGASCKSWPRCLRPPCPFQQCKGRRQSIQGFVSLRVLNIAKLGSKGSQVEAHGTGKGTRERKASQPIAKSGETESQDRIRRKTIRERYGQGTWSSQR